MTANTVRKKKRLKMTVKKGGTQYEQYVGISEHLRSRYFHLHLSCSASVPPQLSPFAFFFLLPVILFFLCASALFLPAQTLFWVSETQLYPHDSRFQFQIFKNFPDIEISFSHFRYSDVIQACDSLLFPSGICCVMQWMFPPPSRISRAGTG